MSDTTYPLSRPVEDPRFTFGLIRDVARVLGEHGYLQADSGTDHVRLQQALFAFIYETDADR